MTQSSDIIINRIEHIFNSDIDLNSRKSDVKELLREFKKVNKQLYKILKIGDKIQRKDYDELKVRYDEIEILNEEIENTQKEVVFTMGTMGEFRSHETGLHVRRVALYSKILGKYYGLNARDADLLFHAAPMHDIGKIGIPDAILNKPGKLDEEEFDIMKNHAKLGHEMINDSDRPLLIAASIIAHEHHEKWDGSGYPRGLAQDEIHIYGRITALADVFDALGSKRIYKNAWNDSEIFSYLKEQSGKQFDPTLIHIFFDNIDEILAVRNRLQDDDEEEIVNVKSKFI
jgi:putative two-component system response regulator